jgi:hypothetical protein
MNNLELVEYAKHALSEKWGYVWGTWGQILTPDLLAAKLRQYPEGIQPYFDFINKSWINRHVTDCVGLIKGYYWNGKYNASSDVSADGMYDKAKEKGDISTIPDIPGICVHKAGHIGVYIGNGQVIEAHGTKYGVIQTPLKGAGSTPWTHWLKCSFIEYIEPQIVEKEEPKVEEKKDIKTTTLWNGCSVTLTEDGRVLLRANDKVYLDIRQDGIYATNNGKTVKLV